MVNALQPCTDHAVLTPADLAMVLLVRDDDRTGPVPTIRLDQVGKAARQLVASGICAVKVFASGDRDELGAGGSVVDSLMACAISEIKAAAPEMVVMTETCLCSYTRTGDCHLTGPAGDPDVPATIKALTEQAVAQADTGADIVGPAAMIGGSVSAIRAALDDTGHQQVQIMPHLIVRSGLYEGYRRTMDATPASGFRVFQLGPEDVTVAVRTGLGFVEEGASHLLLEPAMFTIDILAALRAVTPVPLLPFSVSGEYTTLPRPLLRELFASLKRAGAARIVTYAAAELAESLGGGPSAEVTHYIPGMAIEPRQTSPAAAYFERTLPRRRLRLGSRTSHLAMAYANRVVDALRQAAPDVDVEIVGINTSGDSWKGDLAQLGGKGAFMKEIDKALSVGQIDMAVHAMKDVPGDVPLPKGLMFAAYLERDDVRDCVVWRAGSPYRSLDELPAGTVIGTSAVRRKAQILRARPDLQVERFRGNVIPRLAKLDESEKIQAIVLSVCGLVRASVGDRVGQVLPMDQMCPAVGAGVVGVQCRETDEGIRELLRLIDHPETRTHIVAERTMLHGLQGHCNSPIAGHCTTTPDGQLSLLGMVFSRDGGQFVYAQEWDSQDHPFELGGIVAATLNRKGARDIIAGIPH